MDTSEYIEDIDDDGLDELLEDQSDDDEKLDDLLNVDGEQLDDLKSEEDSKSRISQDDDDFSNDNVLIHRQDPEEKEKLKSEGDLKSEDENIDKDVDPPDLLTVNDDCSLNPNFAVVVDFLDKFAEHLGIKPVPMTDLENHIKDQSGTVDQDLIQIHTCLLKRAKWSKKMLITKRSWEKGLILFCKKSKLLKEESEDLENIGYSSLDVDVKLRMLKVLMEHQFDIADFKIVTETLPTESLRHEPAGKDVDGLRYWTLVDHVADIRVFTEDHSHRTWNCVSHDRNEFQDLFQKLSQNKMYKIELERRKMLELKKQEEQDLKDQIKNLEEAEKSLQVVSEINENNFKCEVCSEDFDFGVDLMKHYAKTHLACKMKEKFGHLVSGGICKVCKESIDDEAEMFVHIAVMHDKLNLILKENGLKMIEPTKSKGTTETKESKVSSRVESIEDDNSKTLEALEQKLKDVQKQMSNSVESNLQVYTMADIKDIAEGLSQSDDEDFETVTKKSFTKKGKSKKSKKRKGRTKKSESPEIVRKSPRSDVSLRRSSRHVPGTLKTDSPKIVDVKDSKVKERQESRLSCHKCGQWEMESNNRVYPCKHCGHGWHQQCCVPPLTRRPGHSWQCPLCDHCQLVTSLQLTRTELEDLLVLVEERRLAEMQVNRSVEVEEEEEKADEEEVVADEKLNSNNDHLSSREVVRNIPDYYESSDDEDLPPARAGCCCSGAGKCLFCKKMRGCTCEGQGTCRLCEMDKEKEEEESDDDIEIIGDYAGEGEGSVAEPKELSTTELFLMTGEIRPPSQTEFEDEISVDEFIDQVDPPPARGRGRGRGRGRPPITRPLGQTVTNIRPRFPHPSGPRLRPVSSQPRPRLTRPGQSGHPPTMSELRLRQRLSSSQEQFQPVIRAPMQPRPVPGSRGRPPRPTNISVGYRQPIVVRGGPRPHVRSPNVRGITPLTSRPRLRAPGPRGPPSRPMMRQIRPNIVHQINQHQPVATQPYQRYMNQNHHIQESTSYASASSYYQQAEQIQDVIDLDDDDDVEEEVLARLPQGIHIERIQKQPSHYDDEVMAKLPPGICIKRV